MMSEPRDLDPGEFGAIVGNLAEGFARAYWPARSAVIQVAGPKGGSLDDFSFMVAPPGTKAPVEKWVRVDFEQIVRPMSETGKPGLVLLHPDQHRYFRSLGRFRTSC